MIEFDGILVSEEAIVARGFSRTLPDPPDLSLPKFKGATGAGILRFRAKPRGAAWKWELETRDAAGNWHGINAGQDGWLREMADELHSLAFRMQRAADTGRENYK